MRAIYLAIAFACMSVTALSAQVIYYLVATGDRYENRTWHSAQLSKFKTEQIYTFDSYTFKRRADGTSVVERDYATPSGDWLVKLKYLYGVTGRLRYVRLNLFTFSGTPEGAGITNCLRTFTVSPLGELRQTSERITDDKTGKVVDRKFWAPHVKHWMSLSELPITPAP